MGAVAGTDRVAAVVLTGFTAQDGDDDRLTRRDQPARLG